MASVTQNDLLDALRSALARPQPGEGCTVMEIAEALDIGEHAARELVKKLLKTGEAECVTVARPRMNGVMARVTGYHLKP